MRSIKAFILSLMIALPVLTAQAVETGDSLSRALATYWGSSISLKDMPAGSLREFNRGLTEAVTAGTDSTRLAYFRGIDLGNRMRSSLDDMSELGMQIDVRTFADALVKVLSGENVGFTPTTAQTYIDRFVGPSNQTADPETEKAFVEAASKIEGATVTPSGLVFIVITEGEGAMPTRDQHVNIEYVARLSNGYVFDRTEGPVNFDLVHLIPGFSEGLQLMKPGGTYRLVIPSEIAYGDNPVGGVIPGGSALDFTVKLLSIDEN